MDGSDIHLPIPSGVYFVNLLNVLLPFVDHSRVRDAGRSVEGVGDPQECVYRILSGVGGPRRGWVNHNVFLRLRLVSPPTPLNRHTSLRNHRFTEKGSVRPEDILSLS